MCNLFAKSKKKYFLNLDPKQKNFGNQINQSSLINRQRKNIPENGKILSSDTNIAETFNDYFSYVIKIRIYQEYIPLNTDLCINTVLAAIEN